MVSVRDVLERGLSMVKSPEDLASMIDSTLLSPKATSKEAEKLVEEANELGFYSVVLTPIMVARISGLAKKLGVRMAAVVGFPLGHQPLESKIAEAKYSLELGVEEIDFVPALSQPIEYVGNELEEIVELASHYGARVKAILEASLWDDARLEDLVEAAARAGVFMVKTSTGVYTKGGDPYIVYRLWRMASPRRLEVKASGGIRTAMDAILAVGAGASRIGTSSGRSLIETFV